MAINPQHELDQSKLTRDTRTGAVKFLSALYRPANFKAFLIGFIAVQLYQPFLWPVWTIAMLALTMGFQDQRYSLPLRMPKDVGGLDPTDYREEMVEESWLFGLVTKSRSVRTLMVAGGILYLGYLRSQYPAEQGRELWLTNSDARTHMFLAATTGGGKSETLIGIADNAMCWGSGCIYADGKASANVPFCLWSLLRRHGREDDFLLLNYLTGGQDPFQAMVEKERGHLRGQVVLPQSNSTNSFADGSADFLLQLMASIIPKAVGEGQKWQQRALNMIDALLRTLCYKRAKGELDISIDTIRHYLSLQNLVQFYIEGREGKIPDLAFLPIKTYFETGLPGFNPSQAHDPEQWDPEVFNQHGYLTGEFSRVLSMMVDTYGFIFRDKYPDVDTTDVLLNNRVLVVMIPSMEKSPSEASSLGKFYISSVRLTMAQNLGHWLEGTRAQVLDANATNSPCPMPIINDEIQVYFAEGIATMYAQARELNFMMISSVQDVQGLKRSEAGQEAASLIANTKIKWTLALEDPEDTFELFRKAGGESYFSMLSGHDSVSGTFSTTLQAQTSATIEKRDRIILSDLKKLNPGEGVMIFKDAVVPCSSYYIPDAQKKSAVLAARINRFIQVERPHVRRLPASAVKIARKHTSLSDYILAQLHRCAKPCYPDLEDPILAAVNCSASHMNEMTRFEISPVERGIVLFHAARKALRIAKQSGRNGYLHAARYDDPMTLAIDEESENDAPLSPPNA
jgi:intracellular multiplication protein IcmO